MRLVSKKLSPHTYKFHEGVADGVILDLKNEARDVPQRLTSQTAIDKWFEQKTKGLNNFQKAVLRKRWATMEEQMSACERKQRIIASIIEDFSIKPRLNNGEELDIKPYEADMRHLINTYIQADPAADLGELGEMSLTELIIETGIHDAIAGKLNEKGKLSRNAIAEGIVNNVRKTIIRDHLTDPRFYEQMSKLLDDLINQSRADTAAYEEFLRKAEALVRRLAAKQPDDGVPAALHGKREATVIYNNLGSLPRTSFQYPRLDDDKAALAARIDWAVRESAPAGWKGDQAREAQVLNALYPILDRDREATLALFEIIKNQPGY